MIALDVHAHLAPINSVAGASTPGVRWDAASSALWIDDHKVGIKALFSPKALLDDMDRREVQHTWISIPPPLYRQSLTAEQSLLWTALLNEGLAKIAAASNGRLSALLHFPMEHPGLLHELTNQFESHPFVGFSIAAGGHPDIVFSNPVYDALWEWLNQREAFVFVHPGASSDARLENFYLENLAGNPIETGIAASHLVMAGIPSRFPRIRFCLAHAGGIFSSLVGRLERGFETSRPGLDATVERPLQAARRFSVDCIAHHAGLLALAKDVFGSDRVVYGSDWPFPMGIATD